MTHGLSSKTMYSMLFPALFLMVFFFIFPFLWAFVLGFTDYSLWDDGSGTSLVGLRNYVRLLRDPDFYNSVKVTLSYVILAVSGHFLLGFTFANLLRVKGIKGKKFISVAILIPWLTPGLVAAFMWRSVFNLDYGWLNMILEFLGMSRVDWLFTHPFLSILIVNWSRGMAVPFLLLSAALESIPETVYDAAKIDGASALATIFYIKIPMIKYSILMTLLVNTFGTLLAFDMIYGLTGGGPLSKTETFSIFIYNEAFKDMSLGYAGAASTVILLLTLGLGLIYIRSMKVEM